MQTIGAEIAAHEVTVEELRSRNVGNLPPATPEGKAARSGTMLDLLQVLTPSGERGEIVLIKSYRDNIGVYDLLKMLLSLQ